MAVLKNRAKMSTSATGTGSPITLGSAEDGYQTFADAGVANADVVRYVIEDGSNFEIGTGTYTASGTTLSRTVSESSNSNNAINLSGSATVFIGAIDDDIAGGPRGVDFNDNVKATFGTGSDLEIYHDGTYSYIKDDTSAQMRFQNGDFQFYSANGFQSIAKFHETSGVDLYYQNSKKFETTSSGVKVTGDAELYGDAPKLTFNDVSGGTQIDFSLQANNGTFTLTDETNSDTVLTAAQNGAVSVYHNNAVKLATTSSGIQTTGTLNVNGAYTLPTSDGSANQVLTTNGSGVVAFADAGGSLDLFAENYDGTSTKPSATGTNTIAIGQSAVAGNADDGIAIGRGANCGTATQNIAIGAFSDCGFNSFAMALGRTAQATGGSSLALGVDSAASHDKSVAIGKSNSNGDDSFAAQIVNNTTSYGAQGNNSIAMGQLAKATAANSIAIGDTATSTVANLIALGGTTDTVKISGAYTLPTADGSANQVLTTDGSGAVTFADAGGGADLYAANESSPAAQPSATGANAIAIGDSAVASDEDAFAGPLSRASGEYSVALGIANNSSSYGAGGSYAVSLGYQSRAMALQSVALGAGAYVDSDSSRGLALGENAYVQQCDYGTAIGAAARVHGGNTITEAMALGSSYASGASSFAAAITNNTSTYGATGANSIAMGYRAKASHSNSTSIGRNSSATNSDAVALGNTATASGASSVAIGVGAVAATSQSIALGLNATVGTSTRGTALGFSANATGSQATAISDSVASGGNSFAAVADATASATDSIAIGRAATASSTYATAIGKNSSDQGSVATSGTAAMALGGSYASGADSLAAAIANNTNSYGAQGANSIVMGYHCKSTGSNGVSLGQNNIVSGNNATAIGYFNTASGYYTTALGYDNTTSAAFGHAIGYQAVSSVNGKGAYASGRFAADGDAQGGLFILRADTTDATATVLTTNNSTAAATNQIVAANDTCIMFSGTLVAMQNGAQDQGGWEIKGLLKNDGGTTTLVSSNIQTFDDGNGWTVALTADNTNNALAITCTGEAAHNIRWVANIQTSEVTYA